MLNVKKTLAKILNALKVDYVVERGTKGTYGWYVKWNSGKCEYWYHFDVTGVSTTAWTAPIYYMDTSTFSNIWSGVFNAAPFCVICAANHSQFLAAYAYSYDKNGVTNFRYISDGQKTNYTVPTSMYAIGTWK